MNLTLKHGCIPLLRHPWSCTSMGVGARAQMHVTATGATYPMRMPMEGSLLFRSERYTPIGCDVLFCLTPEVPSCTVSMQHISKTASWTFQTYFTKYHDWPDAPQCILEVNKFFLFQIVSEIAWWYGQRLECICDWWTIGPYMCATKVLTQHQY